MDTLCSILKLTRIAIFSCLLLHGVANALTSDDCMRKWPGYVQKCVEPSCGYLAGSFISERFIDALTPTCKAILQQFSAREETGLRAGIRQKGCATYHNASHPTNPVVVQTGVSPTFVMCTVPKAGCSQLRTLLLVMTRYPSPVSWIGEEWRVHMAPYPTLPMFESAPGVPEIAVPKLIIGRHPYTRMLSGFLDKMTWTESHGKDWTTVSQVNIRLGRGEAELFEGTAEGFREFVMILSEHVLAGTPVNEHFEPMANVCDVHGVGYHYFLRLEDMATWFPCLRDGLGIGRFSDTGWDHSRKYHSDWYSEHNGGCWWSPSGISCESYAELSKNLLAGTISEIAAAAADVHDIHSTSADSKWKEFYTQEVADVVYEMYRLDFQLFGYSRELSSLG